MRDAGDLMGNTYTVWHPLIREVLDKKFRFTKWAAL